MVIYCSSGYRNVHGYSFDILGRLTLDAVTTLGSGVDGGIRALGYSFNALGLPYQQTSYSNSSATTVANQVQDDYNGLGQLVTEYQEHGGAVNTSTSAQVDYTYDTAAGTSRLSSMTYPNGRVLHFGYDNPGAPGLDNDISRVDYLADDNPASGQSVGQHLQDYLFLGLDTIVQRTDGNGVALSYIQQTGDTLTSADGGDQYTGLNRFGQIIDQNWVNTSTGTSTDRFQYAYDRDGNVLYKDNLVSSSFSELYHANSSASGDNNTTAYDKLNRLTNFRRGTLSSSGHNGSGLDTVSTLNSLSNSQQSFTLDGVGNQTSVTTDGTATSRAINSQNQITALGSTSLAYDNNGNTTTDDQGHTLIYDAWNRQVQVKNGSTVLTSYSFDANGRRTIENPGTASDLYFSSAGQVLEEQQSGATTNQYVWGLGYVNDLVLRDHFNACGSLDTTFSSNGKVTTTVASNDRGYNTLVQPDGKILLFGGDSVGAVIIRYNSDGSLDTSFGSSGVATVTGDAFYDGVIQSDGKIVAVGGDSYGSFVAARFNTDGTLDTSFGSSGVQTVDFGEWDYANVVALQSDGKIVLGGATGGGPGTPETWAIVRLTTSGSLDTSFNSTGKETLSWGSGTDDVINGITVQAGGKIVAAGLANSASGMARFSSSGGLDSSFGSGGTGKVAITTDWDQSMNLEALSDGRLLITGVDAGEVVLRRFTADGLVDNSFGTSGAVLTSFGATDYGFDVGVQPDGKIIAVGGSYSGSNSDGLVVRYNVDGRLDTTFGTSGTVLIWYGSSSYSESDYFRSVAVQSDGQIVAAGAAAGKFALARMNGGVTRLYAQQDANYNVSSVVDVSGNVKQRFIESPFGVMTVLSPTWGTTTDGYAWQYTFQGGRYDPATGMIRFGVRDYRANLGSWMEQDPAGYPDGFNRYAFVLCNPVRFQDSEGLHINIKESNRDYANQVRDGFQRIVGNCLKLSLKPHYKFVLYMNQYIPVTDSYTLSAGKPDPNCNPGCNPCAQMLKRAIDATDKNINIEWGASTKQAHGDPDGITKNRTVSINGDMSRAVVDEIDPVTGARKGAVPPWEIVLWHEVIGHSFLDWDHPVAAWNISGGGGYDPVIRVENMGRKCLSAAQGVQINERWHQYF